MGVNVIKKSRARFRVNVIDLEKHQSRTISISDHDKMTVDDLKLIILRCFEHQRKSI